MRPARWLTATLLALALAAGLTPAQAQDRDRLTPAARAQARAALAGTAAAAPAAWNEIMGAGDIDADPDRVGTDDLATSEILLQAMPATVFTAGDNQYPWGQIEDYQDPNGYSGTWGRAPLKAITCAAVGNHEYLDPRTGPAGFLDYFSPNCPIGPMSSTPGPRPGRSSAPPTRSGPLPGPAGGRMSWTASAPITTVR